MGAIQFLRSLFSSATAEKATADGKGRYDAPVFLSETHQQRGYDREIDEGMSSGMRRYVTLDVTGLSDGELTKLIKGLRREAKGFDLAKLVQIAGFNAEGRRYLAVSGESHLFYQGSSAQTFRAEANGAIAGSGAVSVNYVAMPSRYTDAYEPVNLGAYGTTGAPMFGATAHPRAEELRKQGLVQ